MIQGSGLYMSRMTWHKIVFFILIFDMTKLNKFGLSDTKSEGNMLRRNSHGMNREYIEQVIANLGF